MNWKTVLRTISIFLIFISCVMVFPLFVGIIYHEKEWIAFLMSVMITLVTGGFGYFLWRDNSAKIFRKEGFAIVGLGWMIGSFFGGLPYILSGTMSFIDAYFETVSGFTTTGATILTTIETLPKCVLFWRCLTNWLGGMGIIVLFVAIFPFLGVGGRQLFRSESSASSADGIKPKIRETSRRLWLVYLSLTLLEVAFLMFGGVDFFNSLCLSFCTLATGGFANYNASIAALNSAYLEGVIVVFMYIAGINFFALYQIMRRKLGKGIIFSELITYTGILFASIAAMSFVLFSKGIYPTITAAFRASAFQATSIMTTTGFVTENFEVWPDFCKILLVGLMFVGGCAGSTGGGMKVVRFMISFRFMLNQISKAIHPGLVRSIKFYNQPVNEDNCNEVLGFFVLSIFSVFFFSLVMALTGMDIVSATASVVATLWNIGPGLGKVGAIENYAFISDFGKCVLSMCMILGRLEFFAIAVFFMPSFWKK